LAAAAVAWLVIHGAAGTRHDGCPWHGSGGVERDPLVGLMLAGQRSRPRPGATIRQRWATATILPVNRVQGFGTGPGSRTG